MKSTLKASFALGLIGSILSIFVSLIQYLVLVINASVSNSAGPSSYYLMNSFFILFLAMLPSIAALVFTCLNKHLPKLDMIFKFITAGLIFVMIILISILNNIGNYSYDTSLSLSLYIVACVALLFSGLFSLAARKQDESTETAPLSTVQRTCMILAIIGSSLAIITAIVHYFALDLYLNADYYGVPLYYNHMPIIVLICALLPALMACMSAIAIKVIGKWSSIIQVVSASFLLGALIVLIVTDILHQGYVIVLAYLPFYLISVAFLYVSGFVGIFKKSQPKNEESTEQITH